MSKAEQPARVFPREASLAYELRITIEAMRRAMQERFDRHGVRFAHWSYLRVLWENDGISQTVLSERVGRVGGNTVSALNALERARLVRRVRSKTDRRTIQVFLTPAGRSLESALVPGAMELQGRALSGVSATQLETARKVLQAIRANLGAR